MMIGSFFALMFYILSPVDLGLKKIFYTPMIATACVMTVLFVFSFILAVSGCETDIFVVMMMWNTTKASITMLAIERSVIAVNFLIIRILYFAQI